MDVVIVGVGCKKCDRLVENTRKALDAIGQADCPIRRVEDLDDIADMGVVLTPVLIVDNILLTMGKELPVDRLEKHLGLLLEKSGA
jgi:hypothetical protein